MREKLATENGYDMIYSQGGGILSKGEFFRGGIVSSDQMIAIKGIGQISSTGILKK